MWSFMQEQILGMKWLNKLIGSGLSSLGLDIGTRIGGSVNFFLYDVIKITVLLCVLIFGISYLQSFFPPEQTHFGSVPWSGGEYYRRAFGNGHAVLLLLLHPHFYRLCRCRLALGRHLLFSDLISHG